MNNFSTSPEPTPLHSLHLELGATMVEFAGYALPLRYRQGILNEHLHTRAAAGLFDVSHMGIIQIHGVDLGLRLESLVPSDLQSLPPGAMRYTLLLNKRSGILDDLLVARPADGSDRLTLVVNAACKQRDFAYLREHLADASLELLRETALLALQGPQAAAVLGRFCDAPARLKFMQCAEFDTGEFGLLSVSRSGYTGEDGFEIALDAAQAETFARRLLAEPEVEMAGLGARDSLRLEAGLPLYGHDLDESTLLVESGLGWTVGKRRREQGGFPGFSIIRHELAHGPARQRVGIRPLGKAIAREDTVIQADGHDIGRVSSGGFGPSLHGPLAMGYVETAYAKPGTEVELIVRGQPWPAQVVSLPFVAHRYVR